MDVWATCGEKLNSRTASQLPQAQRSTTVTHTLATHACSHRVRRLLSNGTAAVGGYNKHTYATVAAGASISRSRAPTRVVGRGRRHGQRSDAGAARHLLWELPSEGSPTTAPQDAATRQPAAWRCQGSNLHLAPLQASTLHALGLRCCRHGAGMAGSRARAASSWAHAAHTTSRPPNITGSSCTQPSPEMPPPHPRPLAGLPPAPTAQLRCLQLPLVEPQCFPSSKSLNKLRSPWCSLCTASAKLRPVPAPSPLPLSSFDGPSPRTTNTCSSS